MEKVKFIHLENADDIIISLSCDEDSTFGVDGFIIQRNPKFEHLFPPEERGAIVEWEDDDIIVLLDRVFLNRKELKIITRGKVREYKFDLAEITDDEYRDLVNQFEVINFDKSIKIEVS